MCTNIGINVIGERNIGLHSLAAEWDHFKIYPDHTVAVNPLSTSLPRPMLWTLRNAPQSRLDLA